MRLLLAAAAFLSTVVVAQTPSLPGGGPPAKPNVFVILDTSTSMREAPDHGSAPWTYDTVKNDDTDSTDPSSTPAAQCRSKFCIAKKIVYTVLEGYAGSNEINLGLGTYYQYLVRVKPPDSRRSQCTYDVVWKPNTTLYFPPNGAYDIEIDQRIAPLNAVDLANRSSPTQKSNQFYCSTASDTQYDLSEQVTMAVPLSCTLHNQTSNPTSLSIPSSPPTGSGICSVGKNYTVSTHGDDTTTYVYRKAGSATCDTYVPPATDYSSATKFVVKPSANDTVCATNGTNCWSVPPFTSGSTATECSNGAPCNMYASTAGAGVQVNYSLQAIGFFGGGCTTGSQPGAPNAGDNLAAFGVCPNLSTTANSTKFYDTTRVDSTVTISNWTTNTNQNDCQGMTVGAPTRRTTGGVNGNPNFDYADNASITAALGGAFPSTGFSARTMTPSACAAGWPCDVTLTSKSPGAPATGGWTPVNNCIANPPSLECQGTTFNVPRRLLKTASTCPSLAVETASPGGTWDTAPICGTGVNQCSFSGLTETTAPMPGCSATFSSWNGMAPTDCNYNGIISAYTGGSTSSYSAWVDEPGTTTGGSCQATQATSGFTGSTPGDVSQLSACLTPGPCPISGGTGAISPNIEAPTSTTSLTPPSGGGFAGPFDTPLATAEWSDGPCSGTDGEILIVNGRIVSRVIGPGGGGTSFKEKVGEVDIYKCKFQHVERKYTRPYRRCTYTFSRRDFTTPAQISYCNYQLAQENQRTVTPQFICKYDLAVRTFKFSPPAYRECTYRRTSTVLTRNANMFRYAYQTKGGEYVGEYNKTFANHVCATPYSSFAADCPTSIENCVGTNTRCLLRTSGNSAPSYGFGSIDTTNDGRFSNITTAANTTPLSGKFKANVPGMPSATNSAGTYNGGGRSCLISDYASPVSATGTPATFCSQTGSPPDIGYQIVNDFMQCGDPNDSNSCTPNNINDLYTDSRTDAYSLRPGFGYMPDRGTVIPTGSTYDWTNTNRKSQGLSAVGPNHDQAGLILMPIADDGVSNHAKFKELLSQCEHPRTDAGTVNWPDWAPHGMCLPDTGSPTADPNFRADYTPLWGSLSTARQYLSTELAADPRGACRPYYVVLATDGKENTPANKSQTDLEQAVSALHSVSGGGHTTNVSTFVIGMGDGAAGPVSSSLNGMAVAGGTGQAYFATNAASLQTQLNNIFRRILAGSFSRSKPALSTDGKSIYAAYFDRKALEWVGHFTAYKINSDGTVSPRWELGQPGEGLALGLQSKLDDLMTDSQRNLYTDVGSSRQDFKTSNIGAFSAALTSDVSNYPTGLSPSTIVDFVRNGSKAEPYPNTNPIVRRGSRLNAIVRSSPAPVDVLNRPATWGAESGSSYTSYAAYKAAQATRETQILIGASDGLLRGVRDNSSVGTYPSCSSAPGGGACPDGKEAWGWVPSALQPVLYNQLSGYTPGVDGQIATEDVCANGGNADNCGLGDWKTIAVASVGAGGRGLVALDITRPNDPTYPRLLWSLWRDRNKSGDLGYAPAPTLGRAEMPSGNRFVAIVPGGRSDNGVYHSLNDIWNKNGDEVYVLDALTGNQIAMFDPGGCLFCDLKIDDVFGDRNQFAARASYFSRPEHSYIESAFLSGTNGRLYTMRFRNKLNYGSGTPTSNARNPNQWDPVVFFEPVWRFGVSGSAFLDPVDQPVNVRRVRLNTGTNAYEMGPCATDALATCGSLPLPYNRALPFWQRPKLSTVYDTDDVNKADVFLVTGDANSPDAPNPAYYWNYVYAVHDMQSRNDGDHDGRAMWVNQLLNKEEQIVSEPVMSNGNLIVTSYMPPSTITGCNLSGDVLFYCFDPKTGDTRDCFVLENGQSSAVVKYANVGIPSDPVVVNGVVYWTSSTTGVLPPGQGATGQTPNSGLPSTSGVIHGVQTSGSFSGGRVRSFRRIR